MWSTNEDVEVLDMVNAAKIYLLTIATKIYLLTIFDLLRQKLDSEKD